MTTIEQIREFFRAKKLEGGLFLASVTLIVSGVYLWNRGVMPEKIEILKPVVTLTPKMIQVDVAGAVNTPGVIKLVLGSRIGEAIASAGGINEQADSEWISQNLNQAKIVSDGEKIYIPSIKNQKSNDPVIQLNNKININSASESELDKLPGIGEVTAGKIIAGRPYASIEELKDKKIVSDKVWIEIKDQISAW